jgi:hypothetical protein
VCMETLQGVQRSRTFKVQFVEKAQGARNYIFEKIFKSEVFRISEATRRVLKEHSESVHELRRKSTERAGGELLAISNLRRSSAGIDQVVGPSEGESKAEPLKNIKKYFIRRKARPQTEGKL